MLRPTSVREHFSTASLRSASQPRADSTGIDRVASTTGGGETLDLRADIARRMEEDVDYQILKKTFALESGRVLSAAPEVRAESRVASVADAPRGMPLQSLELGDLRALSEASTLDLRVTWTRTSAWQIELSARGETIDLSARTLGFEATGQTLDLHVEAPAPVQVGDPLVLDLGGQGFETTGLDEGVAFDLTGNGQLDQMSTVTGGSWLLALDVSRNGRIDDGKELFGDQNGAANGFEELAKHDSNGDGRIDSKDDVYDRLRLLQIRSDGSQVTQSLDEAKVTSIELGYQNTRKALNLYDQVAQTAGFTRSDGGRGEASDLLLGYRRLA